MFLNQLSQVFVSASEPVCQHATDGRVFSLGPSLLLGLQSDQVDLLFAAAEDEAVTLRDLSHNRPVVREVGGDVSHQASAGVNVKLGDSVDDPDIFFLVNDELLLPVVMCRDGLQLIVSPARPHPDHVQQERVEEPGVLQPVTQLSLQHTGAVLARDGCEDDPGGVVRDPGYLPPHVATLGAGRPPGVPLRHVPQQHGLQHQVEADSHLGSQ